MRLYRAGRLTREMLDAPHSAGLFYNPATLTADDIALLEQYARLHDLECMTRDAFITTVFYPWVYRYGALLIGHNLPFDLGALATRWTDAAGGFRGGFSLTLCSCGHAQCFNHPPVRVKMLGRMKALIRFGRIAAPTKTGRQYKRAATGKFLDTATLGRALLGPGDSSLAGLGRRFGVDMGARKAAVPGEPEHGAALTTDYLDYARQDVAATWALYQAERALYRRHGVSAPLWSIYSEASLGKAYFKELGVPRFMQQHPDFPPDVMGYGMAAYYGGRSEVKIRLQPTEVIYTDFKSQYPTVNALMGLQDLLLAERIEVRQGAEVAAGVRAWLALVVANGPDELHTSAAWRRLRCLVKVRPDGDLLPVRARYGPEGTNIGLNYLTGLPVWYTLADVVASTLLTGKAPEVLEAIELVPIGRVETRPLDLFGDPRYHMDLNKRDLFTGVIDLRSTVQKELTRVRKAAAGTHDPAEKARLLAEAERLDALQLALKLLANSTSYGVLVEINADEARAHSTPVTVYGLDTRQATTRKVERPGPYFAGAIGALIPAAGRLLLALAERLATDRGIGHALCDTDSFAFARPTDMDRATFGALVQDICDWFTPLSPYRGQPPILEREDVNDWPAGSEGQPEPLYALCVSAKRYALYNRLPDGSYRTRKFSSHGVGTWQGREGYTSPPHVPDPCEPVHKLANGAGERWAYDLWYDAIAAIDGGTVWRDDVGIPCYYVAPSAWLNNPAFHRLTVSTADLYRAHKDIPGLRPFSFITVLPSLEDFLLALRRMTLDDTTDLPIYDGLEHVGYYASYARAASDLHDVRRKDTGARVEIRHKTVAECLVHYYTHYEWKAAEPGGVGVLPRRHVSPVQHIHIGKESDRVQLVALEDTDGAIVESEAQQYSTAGLSDTLRHYAMRDLVRETGVPRQTLYDIINGASPTHTLCEKIQVGLARLTRADGRVRTGGRGRGGLYGRSRRPHHTPTP